MEKLTYTRVPSLDTTIIGTNHCLNPLDNSPERKIFREEVSSWKKLALEGNRVETYFYSLAASMDGFKNYELFAQEVGPKQFFYLEENVDWHTLARKYGMSNEFFETIDALAVLAVSLSLVGDNLSDEEVISTRGRYELERNGDLDRLPNYSLRSRLSHLLAPQNNIVFQDIQLASNLYTLWYAHIRDYETICPSAREFCKEEGKKGIICGQTHVKPLVKFLQTGKIKTPLQWEDFKLQYPVEDWKTSANKIERLLKI